MVVPPHLTGVAAGGSSTRETDEGRRPVITRRIEPNAVGCRPGSLSAMAKPERKGKSLAEIGEILGFGNFDTHLFICTGPDCCDEPEGMAAWQAVKRAVKEFNPDLRQAKIYRTKVGCLRVCSQGPIAVAYPQGKWFHSVTEAAAADIVAYLQSGATAPHPLEFANHPLPPPVHGGDASGD